MATSSNSRGRATSSTWTSRAGSAPYRTRRKPTWRVMVPDVDRYWELAKKIGARIVRPIADQYYGLRDFTIADPDGFGVRFGTNLPAQEQDQA